MSRYFGTDGIRGMAGKGAMQADVVLRIAQATGQVIKQNTHHARPVVVIGKDPRLSGYMIESALQAGFTSVGFFCLLVGPLPTPAVSMLTRSLRTDLGVMITASHNPYHDNGIKMFTPDGIKLQPKMVAQIETLIDAPEKIELAENGHIGKAKRIDDAVGRYMEATKLSVPKSIDFSGKKIVVDCANGATYHIAPKMFWELGADVTRIGTDPNGTNINKNCGALHPERLQKEVKRCKADIGFAFDGDGDRLMVCDEKGNILDGDHILAAMATFMQTRGELRGDGIVGTVMTNMGCEAFLKENGLDLVRTKVGDHHVEAAMRAGNYNLGGESSGHIIMSDHAPTGDGILAAMQFLSAMQCEGKTASEMGKLYTPWPQKMENIRLSDNTDSQKLVEELESAIQKAEEELAINGRVLVRPSGTEPLLRIMVEAKCEKDVEKHCAALVSSAKNLLKKQAA